MSLLNSDGPSLRGQAAKLVAAFVSYNAVPAVELPALYKMVHGTLTDLIKKKTIHNVDTAGIRDSSEINKSITPDALISFIDGKSYKTLKRHLAAHGLNPQTYCDRYGLPSDYPMVAASYAARRSVLARQIRYGLPNVLAPSEQAL